MEVDIIGKSFLKALMNTPELWYVIPSGRHKDRLVDLVVFRNSWEFINHFILQKFKLFIILFSLEILLELIEFSVNVRLMHQMYFVNKIGKIQLLMENSKNGSVSLRSSRLCLFPCASSFPSRIPPQPPFRPRLPSPHFLFRFIVISKNLNHILLGIKMILLQFYLFIMEQIILSLKLLVKLDLLASVLLYVPCCSTPPSASQ